MRKHWAIAQINAGSNVRENLDRSLELAHEASEEGCSLIAYPEFFLVRGDQDTTRNNPIPIDSEPVKEFCSFARKTNTHVLMGTIPIPDPDRDDYVYNTAIYIDDSGTIASRYRKIHLFDIELEDEFTLRESDVLSSGQEVVDTEIDNVHAGLSICYDLRFPELFRKLADRRVQVIFVPSNFTRETGRAHWEPLLRARAIENQCYIVAPNQIGENPENGVHSLGQSMVVDPWGQVIARASDREDWFGFTVDTDYVHSVRRQLPSLDHIELI
ncbi:MAG: carbon-nitrogen hydrolase family protein [bacterium]